MKCEACGGDGLIEVGAYRGDDSGPTRECRLCGGVVTGTAETERVAERLRALGRAGITLKESTSGVRRTIERVVLTRNRDGYYESRKPGSSGDTEFKDSPNAPNEAMNEIIRDELRKLKLS